MYKAVIIEDEKPAAEMLEGMLSEWAPEITVSEKCGDLPTGVAAIRKHQPQIVFLDVELPVYSGIQLPDFFYIEELTFHIIFTTASSQYAVKAFEMSAVDYLMKPVQEDKLKTALRKIYDKQLPKPSTALPLLKANLVQEGHSKMLVPVKDGFEIINLKEVFYLQAEGSYTRIFLTTDKAILVSKNLRHFEFILNGMNGFFRTHRSYIVNLSFCKKLLRTDGTQLIMENKTALPVSEEKVETILACLKNL